MTLAPPTSGKPRKFDRRAAAIEPLRDTYQHFVIVFFLSDCS
jgi:hypothetical protein